MVQWVQQCGHSYKMSVFSSHESIYHLLRSRLVSHWDCTSLKSCSQWEELVVLIGLKVNPTLFPWEICKCPRLILSFLITIQPHPLEPSSPLEPNEMTYLKCNSNHYSSQLLSSKTSSIKLKFLSLKSVPLWCCPQLRFCQLTRHFCWQAVELSLPKHASFDTLL